MADPVDKPKNGRPRIEFSEKDWNQLESMCQLHCTAEEIAGMMECSIDTVEARIKEKYDMAFPEYFAQKSSGGKMSLRRKQYQTAMAGDKTMLVWLGKNWLKQKDKIEHSGDSNAPLILNYKLDESK